MPSRAIASSLRTKDSLKRSGDGFLADKGCKRLTNPCVAIIAPNAWGRQLKCCFLLRGLISKRKKLAVPIQPIRLACMVSWHVSSASLLLVPFFSWLPMLSVVFHLYVRHRRCRTRISKRCKALPRQCHPVCTSGQQGCLAQACRREKPDRRILDGFGKR